MIFALAAVSVALIAVVLVGYRREQTAQAAHDAILRALLKEWGDERREAANERCELLERIQRPERLPSGFAQEDYHVPHREPDDWAQVGTNDLSAPRDEIQELANE